MNACGYLKPVIQTSYPNQLSKPVTEDVSTSCYSHTLCCCSLLQDCVYRIKEAFNKEFEEVLRLKRVEIARIQEKNVRISKIISQLKLDETIVQPLLSPDEEPERLLVVEVGI